MLQSAVRFGIVGILATLIDFLLFAGLHLWLGVLVILANTISYSTSIVTKYFMHRSWTFANRPRKPMKTQFPQFALVSLSGLVLNDLLILLLAKPLGLLFGSSNAGSLMAKVCATGVILVWNFVINHFWIFN